jgi:hypothetical protein
MATFIPARVGAISACGIYIKRALKVLDDDHVVRTPIQPSGWLPDFFVQHPKNGWLAIAVADTPFSALTGELFENAERAAFDKLLADFQAWPSFPDIPNTDRAAPGKLIMMWKCHPDEVCTIAGRYLSRIGIRLLAKTQFLELAAKLVPRGLKLLHPIAGRRLILRSRGAGQKLRFCPAPLSR